MQNALRSHPILENNVSGPKETSSVMDRPSMQKTVNIKFLIWIQVAKIAAATMGPQSSGLVGKNLSKRNCNSNVFHYQGKDFGNQ